MTFLFIMNLIYSFFYITKLEQNFDLTIIIVLIIITIINIIVE